jgi:hypothetical protein
LISGDGPVGATLYWTLTTPKPVVTSVEPCDVLPGQDVLIRGDNLPSDPSLAIVQINGTAAHVSNATKSSMQITIPKKTATGTVSVNVFVNGIEAGALKVNVKPWPVITGLSTSTIVANQKLLIYGENFSSNASDINVMIGPYRATVMRATETELTIQVPGAFSAGYFSNYPDWYLPITVDVNGIKARNKVSLNVLIDS